MINPLVTASELAALLDGATNRGAAVRVLDVRWSLGGPEGRPLYAAGHIPGAISAPTDGNLDETGHFPDPAALRERYEALGVCVDRAVGVYCGSGIIAAHDALALTVAGFRPALFAGSWSAWSNQPDRPVATGATP